MRMLASKGEEDIHLCGRSSRNIPRTTPFGQQSPLKVSLNVCKGSFNAPVVVGRVCFAEELSDNGVELMRICTNIPYLVATIYTS